MNVDEALDHTRNLVKVFGGDDEPPVLTTLRVITDELVRLRELNRVRDTREGEWPTYEQAIHIWMFGQWSHACPYLGTAGQALKEARYWRLEIPPAPEADTP